MNHQWKFFRAGGFDQVKVETGADLMNLDQLDQKLWVALACPATGLEFDAKTLALIDADKDGRIRAPELIAAVQWAGAMLKNPDDLLKSSPSLLLSAINEATPLGKQLLSSARQILANLGKKDSAAITLEDTADTAKIFAQTNFNGDGIVPADAAGDAATKAIIADIIACLGPETDRSGKPGVSQARVDQFFAEAQTYSDWWKQAEGDTKILPLGEKTSAAAAAVKVVKAKVDDYFARCRLAAFDARAVGALNREEKEYLAFAAKDLTITAAEIAALPLARVAADKPLPLQEGVNPAWAAALATLQSNAVKPLLGDRSLLSESDWAALNARLGPYECWAVGKAGVAVEKLGLKRVREILAGKAKESIATLIAQDKALEPEANAIAAVEQLVRYHRDLFKLCTNFVSFRDFYGRKDKAIFQAGTLYLDQRSCDLCLTVEDAAKHAAMAALAGTYLAYCDCVRKGTGEKLQIVAAFTGGDSDNLMVGRNGIFYDRKGRDWDATITRLLDNPISIRQAFWAPYKKCLRLIEEQVAKRASAAGDAATARMQAAAATDQPPPPPPPPKKIDPGMLAALGLVLSTLLVALGGIFAAFTKLPLWQMPLAIAGILLAVSIPSMIIAWLKLRKRNLGPILDANGWAVNAKAKINVPFGRSLTQVAVLPPGSQRDLVDPFAEKRKPWGLYAAIIVILLLAGYWYLGKLDKVLPGKIKSTTVLGTNAPAYTPAGLRSSADSGGTNTNAPATSSPAK
ncbi:MAG: hypothetical protein ABSD57_04095 [Verrucomicrobiota bacterium]|jgi:hypothetical protein